MEVKELIDDVEALIRETGAFIKEELGKVAAEDIEAKALNSLVSYVDKQAEEILVKGLMSLLPDCGFITEEDTPDDNSKDYVWIIDPLDGTTNFLRQIPHFSVSVALQVDGVVQLGFVYNVMLEEMFSAGKGHGAFLNGKKVSVSSTDQFRESIIATGFPYDNRDSLPFVEVLKQVMIEGRGIRRFGSAALDLAYTAVGRLDAYYECCINRWDVAAGILLVQEAGGVVSDFNGGPNFEDGKKIIASNPHIHPRLLQIIASIGMKD
jgi:myo-inositol-1(or 4)-monophosphatase